MPHTYCSYYTIDSNTRIIHDRPAERSSPLHFSIEKPSKIPSALFLSPTGNPEGDRTSLHSGHGKVIKHEYILAKRHTVLCLGPCTPTSRPKHRFKQAQVWLYYIVLLVWLLILFECQQLVLLSAPGEAQQPEKAAVVDWPSDFHIPRRKKVTCGLSIHYIIGFRRYTTVEEVSVFEALGPVLLCRRPHKQSCRTGVVVHLYRHPPSTSPIVPANLRSPWSFLN